MNIKIPDQDCNQLRTACDKIAKETETTIALTEPLPQSSFTSQNTVNILITGIPNQAEKARINILVMLDKQVRFFKKKCRPVFNTFVSHNLT